MRRTHPGVSQTGAPVSGDSAALPPGGLSASVAGWERLLKQQCKRYRKALKRCQARFSEDAIHQSRVETRRLLAMADLLAPMLPQASVAKLERGLKRHLDTFADLRDTQVHLLLLRRLRQKHPAARQFVEYLRRREERLSSKTRKGIKRIRTGKVARLVEACRASVTKESRKCPPNRHRALVLRAIRRAFHRVCALYDRIDWENTETIHRTRIAFKHFRYMVEALARNTPGMSAEYRAELHHYQDLMGKIQDAETLLAAFNRWLLKKNPDLESAHKLQARLAAHRAAQVLTYQASAARLLQYWPPHPSATTQEAA